jgi:thiosulfate/3-mercaptopyruvate sulfurtransferase
MHETADARASVLVTTEWLEEHLHDPAVRVVEVDVSTAAHQEGHIPGAVLWNVYTDLKDPEYRPVSRAALEGLIERSGIVRNSIVVFYGYAPALGFWLMKLFDHPDVRILDASRTTWQEQQRPWTSAVTRPVASRYPLPEENSQVRAARSIVEQLIDDPDHIILDVRTDAEFRSERFWPSGAQQPDGRNGHVPTAASLPADGVLDADGSFKEAGELRKMYAPLDLRDHQEVITYCAVGGRASTSWFVLTYLLGHQRARVYDASWAEWGRLPDTPVTVGG